MSCCCQPNEPEPEKNSCCGPIESGCCDSSKSIDWLLWGSLIVIIFAYLIDWSAHDMKLKWMPIDEFSHGIHSMLTAMWWGILGGVFAVGVMHQIPREAVIKVIGRPGSIGGILRSVAAGMVLDLCNHGILLVGIKFYERGASLGQVFAFMIASPWNSFSLTLILMALVGLPLTIIFVLCSGLIAIISGLLVDRMLFRKLGQRSDHQSEVLSWADAWNKTREAFPSRSRIVSKIFRDGFAESRMILRWVSFGVVLASAIRAIFNPESFQAWFGPSLSGLVLTLIGATLIEVCSEGSTPISADLVNRARAPGNGFVFLMAGAATDYTEIMALKEATGGWRSSLLLPAVTVPQVLVIGYLINVLGN